jgi:hypothetical protein
MGLKIGCGDRFRGAVISLNPGPNLALISCIRPLNPPILGDFEELELIENEYGSYHIGNMRQSKSPRIGGFRGPVDD